MSASDTLPKLKTVLRIQPVTSSNNSCSNSPQKNSANILSPSPFSLSKQSSNDQIQNHPPLPKQIESQLKIIKNQNDSDLNKRKKFQAMICEDINLNASYNAPKNRAIASYNSDKFKQKLGSESISTDSNVIEMKQEFIFSKTDAKSVPCQVIEIEQEQIPIIFKMKGSLQELHSMVRKVGFLEEQTKCISIQLHQMLKK